MKPTPSEPILFVHEPEPSSGEVIDFNTHRLDLVRRALSHDVVHPDDDDFDDDIEFSLFAVAGRRFR